MRLGGPTLVPTKTPEEWVAALRKLGYSTAACPVGPESPQSDKVDYRRAAERADIVIAEVGAWSNPISTDSAERAKAMAYCQRQLALAEEMDARCCVNIAGSRGKQWDGPDPDNLSQETFDLIVETVRQIVDAVKPSCTVYTLEPMPWVLPDSPDSYLALMKAIDRRGFAVHLDPVNMINCPSRAYRSGDFLRECFAKLGPHIRCCHAKDIHFTQHLTVHLDECRPGLGMVDYRVFLQELGKLSPDLPVLMEHMTDPGDYEAGADYIRKIAIETGTILR
jgi:sugar phosphate isomerase/epimerase